MKKNQDNPKPLVLALRGSQLSFDKDNSPRLDRSPQERLNMYLTPVKKKVSIVEERYTNDYHVDHLLNS